MTAWIFAVLLFQLATPATRGPYDVVLDVDVLRGAVRPATSSADATGTAIVPPWASGWSSDTERLRTEIRDVARLDRASLVLAERLMLKNKRTGTIRGSDYWVAVRFIRFTTKNADLEIRLVRDQDAEKGFGALPALRVSTETNKTFVVRGGSEAEPLFAAVTMRDPYSLWGGARCLPPQTFQPIRPSYPEPARRTTRGGTIVVKALIDNDGSLVEPFVFRSLQPDLDAAALDTVRNARFRPATIEGKPVPAMVTASFDFYPTIH